MKIRYIKGTRVIGGINIGEGEYFTFTAAQLKDPYISRRVRKALAEGRIQEAAAAKAEADKEEDAKPETKSKSGKAKAEADKE